jgi:hypothetical protein
MSPSEAGAATLTVIILAILAAYRILCWLLDRHIRARREVRRWQQTTSTRRTRADVEADLAAAREARQLVEQHAFDQEFARIIAAEFPTIPHQTRRTEEDQ